MELSGEYRILAPRETVWRALNDAAMLQASIPGCESLEKVSDTEFVAKISTRIGPVSAKFGGKVTLTDLDPPNGYRIVGEGQGGAAGFAKGAARVSLVDDGAGGTILRYQADASVGGKIAQIGSRLVQGAAQKTADEFFTRFSALVTGGAPAGAEAALAAAAAPSTVSAAGPAAGPPPAVRRGLSPIVWIGGLVAILALLLAWFAFAD
jgi:carbon monoxide dehydrogenase subunit G